MATPEENLEAVKDLLSSPQRTTGDEGTVLERPTDDIIKGLNYEAAIEAQKKRGRGLRFSVHKMPGTP